MDRLYILCRIDCGRDNRCIQGRRGRYCATIR